MRLDGSEYNKLNEKIRNKDEICEDLKSILGAPKLLLNPYEDVQPIFDFKKENEDQITYEIQENKNPNDPDLLLENEDGIDLSSNEEIEEAQAKAQNEEIDSEDDTDFDVEKEKSRKELSQISQKKKIGMLISLYFT